MKPEEKSAGYFSGVGMSAHETRHEMDYGNVLLKPECLDMQGRPIFSPGFTTYDSYIYYLTQKLGFLQGPISALMEKKT